jgi:aminoglycoside phosphotransferase family enzyme
MHGDFHPGNIIFKENGGFQVLDASRELWGDPADDITTLAINYIWYSLMQRGDFSGPFAELFNIFWNNYLKKTKDDGVSEIVGLFFAFRGVVVAHSIFYKEQSNSVRRKIFNFVKGVLRDKQFHPRKINTYIRG